MKASTHHHCGLLLLLLMLFERCCYTNGEKVRVMVVQREEKVVCWFVWCHTSQPGAVGDFERRLSTERSSLHVQCPFQSFRRRSSVGNDDVIFRALCTSKAHFKYSPHTLRSDSDFLKSY